MAIVYRNGQWQYTEADMTKMQTLMRRVSASDDQRVHQAFASVIIPPIRQIAAYQEWTGGFFQSQTVDLNNLPRIAVDNPSMIALYTGPTGETMFVRPGRTTYVTPTLVMVDCGLEIGWDDIPMAGWDVLSQKMQEAGEELARKRDEQGQNCLDTACAAVTGHISTITGGKMTKAGVDAIIKAAAKAGWTLRRAVVNTATFMDQSDWAWANATHLWQNPVKDGEILTNLSVSGYGGLTWQTFTSCPSDKVYFTATPAICGAYRWNTGGLRAMSAIDIRKKTDLHSWDQKIGHSWYNPYAVWCLQINA